MTHDLTYRFVVGGLRVAFAALGLRLDISGADRVPARGGAVLVANHIGYLDFALLGYLGRERGRFVRFLAKSGVFESPIVGRAMRAMRHVPVVRTQGAGAVRQAERLLVSGEVVGVFAEATISRSFLVKPLARGAAAMAIAARVPLVPVVTFGGHRVLSVDRRRSLRRRTPGAGPGRRAATPRTRRRPPRGDRRTPDPAGGAAGGGDPRLPARGP